MPVSHRPIQRMRAFGPGFGAGFQRGAQGSSTVPILRFSFTIAALTQMLVYSSVVLYSVIFGGIDLVIPAKIAFLMIVFVLVMKPFDDFTIAWRNRTYEPLGAQDAVLYFGVVLLAAGVSVLYDLSFIVVPLPSTDLHNEAIG